MVKLFWLADHGLKEVVLKRSDAHDRRGVPLA